MPETEPGIDKLNLDSGADEVLAFVKDEYLGYERLADYCLQAGYTAYTPEFLAQFWDESFWVVKATAQWDYERKLPWITSIEYAIKETILHALAVVEADVYICSLPRNKYPNPFINLTPEELKGIKDRVGFFKDYFESVLPQPRE